MIEVAQTLPKRLPRTDPAVRHRTCGATLFRHSDIMAGGYGVSLLTSDHAVTASGIPLHRLPLKTIAALRFLTGTVVRLHNGPGAIWRDGGARVLSTTHQGRCGHGPSSPPESAPLSQSVAVRHELAAPERDNYPGPSGFRDRSGSTRAALAKPRIAVQESRAGADHDGTRIHSGCGAWIVSCGWRPRRQSRHRR
jgi:hypothetical protein